jgi:formamidopyrimidine-DNA glycosylase
VPELPEVETARRLIERHLAGKTLIDIDNRLPKLLRDSPIADLSVLRTRRLVAVRRRAKVLTLEFDGDLSLLMHLKLAGQVAIFSPDGTRYFAGHPVPKPDAAFPHKSTHIDFVFNDGTIFYLSDIRQFGWLRLMPTADVESAIAAFGFGPEGTLPASMLRSLEPRMATRSIPIKTLLLDQKFVAGLGNIYVDEALLRAMIHPERPASSLTGPERQRLLEAIPWALEEGLKQGGAKIINSRAEPVDDFPAVHGREGEHCFRCGTPIVKTRVGQRGTYYCPTCQKVRGTKAKPVPTAPVVSGAEVGIGGK